MSAGNRLSGNLGGLNLNSGNYASPTWTPIPAFGDVNLNMELITFDSSDRNTIFDTELGQRYKITADAEFLWDPSNTQLVALLENFLNANSTGDTLLIDNAANVNTATGVRCEWLIKKWPKPLKMKDGQKIKIELRPYGNYTEAPLFYTT